jgi:hypothetical protein
VLLLFFVFFGNLSIGWMWFLVPAVVVQPGLLNVDHPQRLYLLGVDYRAQLLHRLATFWVTPAMLVVALWVLLAAALGSELDWPLTWLALVIGLTLFAGGWYGWPNLSTFFTSKAGCGLILGMHFVLAVWLGYLITAGHWMGIPDPGWSTTMRTELFAAACGTFGLAGLLYKLLWLDEARLRKSLLETQALQAHLAVQQAQLVKK